MAQRTAVTLTDDIDGTEATGTVALQLDGRAYEIDLHEQLAAIALRAATTTSLQYGSVLANA